MSKILVHHLETSRSHRALWMLEELELDYEIKHYKRNPKTLRAPDSLKKVHPLGKAPVVTLEDGAVLAESGAILEELVERYGNGRFIPEKGSDEHRRYRYWMHYAEGSLMLPLFVYFLFDKIRTNPAPFFVKPIIKGLASKVDKIYTNDEIEKHFRFVEGELAQRPWCAGDEFTAADIQMSYALEAAVTRVNIGASRPAIAAFVEKVRERPAYKRAKEAGGPGVKL